jgi:hypothetical protein
LEQELSHGRVFGQADRPVVVIDLQINATKSDLVSATTQLEEIKREITKTRT